MYFSLVFFFFKQKTAYEMRISDWSSDVCSSDLVIAPGAQGATVDTITVTLTDRKEYKARVVGRDAKSDLAVLKIEASDLPYVKFGDSGDARVGDWVIAIGNPFGIGSSVTAGIISAVHRTTELGGYDHFIQTDASINRSEEHTSELQSLMRNSY